MGGNEEEACGVRRWWSRYSEVTPHTIENYNNTYKGFLRRYEGSFPVEKLIRKLANHVTLPPQLKVHLVFHVSFLKPHHVDKDDPR